MKLLLNAVPWLYAIICLVSARRLSSFRPLPRAPLVVDALTGNATFEQYIDHEHPELGTFSQRYWWSDEFWAGPGSPVVLLTPGETAADLYTGYLTNRTITGLIAQAIGGAVIMIEHRYWGGSSPYDDLTTKNLQQLTVKNAIADFTNFAKTISLPFDSTNSSQAETAPWVLSGGSYSGALAAWTESTAPGTFWAYHSSSAQVEAIYDYWQYFVPIQEHMPQNCSRDVALVIDYVDGVLEHETFTNKQSLKEMFGLKGLAYDDDFVSVLQNGPWLWILNDFHTGYSQFYQFCDNVENAVGNMSSVPNANGVGLQKALNGYSSWLKTQFIPGYCASYGDWTQEDDISCFDTYNASSPVYTDYSVGNTVHRQYQWLLCNEPLAFWNDAAPPGRPSIVSRLITASYWQRQCGLLFPQEGSFTYGSAQGKSVADFNTYTQGWDPTNTKRLIWSNGQFDPWITASVSSQFRQGGPLESTPQAPIHIIPGGFHCSDLLAKNGIANAGVQAVIDNEIAQIKAWVEEYYV